ncbi:MAG TPA: hypothetical protein VK158_01365 [Acidobacteriota bacterium]|nr:hypothetical protein [Acidobacteriota bacterium]
MQIKYLLLLLLLTGCSAQIQQTSEQEQVGVVVDYVSSFPYIETARGGVVVRNGSPIQNIIREYRYAYNDTTQALTFTDKGTYTVIRKYIVGPSGAFYCEDDSYTQKKTCAPSQEAQQYINAYKSLVNANQGKTCIAFENTNYTGLEPYNFASKLENKSIQFEQCVDSDFNIIINGTAVFDDKQHTLKTTNIYQFGAEQSEQMLGLLTPLSE